jgi:hypothetical protein
MGLIDGEDDGYEKIVTIYQSSNRTTTMKILTWKGLTKFLARSSHKKADLPNSSAFLAISLWFSKT